MKYLFLDVDGVVVAYDGLCLAKRRYPETTLHKDAAEAVRQIIKATDAKVIITSSWRNLETTKNYLEQMFAAESIEIHGYLQFGKYVSESYVSNLLKTLRIEKEQNKKYNTRKGILIHHYLDKYTRADKKIKFAIVDNMIDDIRPYFKDECIFATESKFACLTEDEATKIIKYLGGKAFWRTKRWLGKRKSAKAKKSQ